VWEKWEKGKKEGGDRGNRRCLPLLGEVVGKRKKKMRENTFWCPSLLRSEKEEGRRKKGKKEKEGNLLYTSSPYAEMSVLGEEKKEKKGRKGGGGKVSYFHFFLSPPSREKLERGKMRKKKKKDEREVTGDAGTPLSNFYQKEGKGRNGRKRGGEGEERKKDLSFLFLTEGRGGGGKRVSCGIFRSLFF